MTEGVLLQRVQRLRLRVLEVNAQQLDPIQAPGRAPLDQGHEVRLPVLLRPLPETMERVA
jgi:hypothetical protein